MSQSIQRGMRRLQAIQQSRNLAWTLFAALLPVGAFLLFVLVTAVRSGLFFSGSSLIIILALLAALWIASHLFREARRLGLLLRDRERIMSADRDPELFGDIRWAGLLPFGGPRDQA